MPQVVPVLGLACVTDGDGATARPGVPGVFANALPPRAWPAGVVGGVRWLLLLNTAATTLGDMTTLPARAPALAKLPARPPPPTRLPLRGSPRDDILRDTRVEEGAGVAAFAERATASRACVRPDKAVSAPHKWHVCVHVCECHCVFLCMHAAKGHLQLCAPHTFASFTAASSDASMNVVPSDMRRE